METHQRVYNVLRCTVTEYSYFQLPTFRASIVDKLKQRLFCCYPPNDGCSHLGFISRQCRDLEETAARPIQWYAHAAAVSWELNQRSIFDAPLLRSIFRERYTVEQMARYYLRHPDQFRGREAVALVKETLDVLPRGVVSSCPCVYRLVVQVLNAWHRETICSTRGYRRLATATRLIHQLSGAAGELQRLAEHIRQNLEHQLIAYDRRLSVVVPEDNDIVWEQYLLPKQR